MEIISQNVTATNTTAIEFKFSAEEFEAAINAVYNKRKSKITVPGFRKGKAPRKIIESHYGEGVFYEDAVNSLYNRNVGKLIDETGLDVVDVQNAEVTDVNKDNGVSFKADIITKPVIEISDYKGLEVKKTTKTVTEDSVNEEIEKLRKRNGREISVDNRAVEEGDKAIIDFEGFIDGVAFEGGKGDKFPLEIGSHTFIPGFEEQIIGKNIGEEFDVNVTFPEDYQADNLKGKAAVFKCKLHEIKGTELPELNDDFAKDVDDEADTLDELKAKIKTNLEKKAAENADNQFDNDLVDALLTKMSAEIPQVMYDRRVDEIAREWSNRNRISIEDYLRYTGLSAEQFRANFTDVAKKQVDLRLCLEKIAEIENIEVTDEDAEKEYSELAEQYSMEVDKVKNAIPVDAIKNDLKIEKALDVVKDSAKVEEVTE
jgi:trigger factor